MEIIGAQRVPTTPEKAEANEGIAELIERKSPPQFYAAHHTRNADYEIFPQKFLHRPARIWKPSRQDRDAQTEGEYEVPDHK
jgi:hypothetical protein